MFRYSCGLDKNPRLITTIKNNILPAENNLYGPSFFSCWYNFANAHTIANASQLYALFVEVLRADAAQSNRLSRNGLQNALAALLPYMFSAGTCSVPHAV